MSAGLCFEVLTIFPDVIESFVSAGVLGRAIERGVVQVHATNIRDFAGDKHRRIDDAPFGGGAGMVMKPGPVIDALAAIGAARGPMHRVLLTPSAPRFDQRAAQRLARLPRIALVCGRYEGIDERVREHYIDECFSIGDYVLGGGEVAALVLVESVSRLVDGVMGNPESAVSESFSDGDDGATLEYPQYTRPAQFRGLAVPDVLLAGDHGAVARWRTEAARRRTWALRPDLRPVRALPSATTAWLAIDHLTEPTELSDLVRVSRFHRVAGIAVLGGPATALRQALGASDAAVEAPEHPERFAVGFSRLKELRKHLRRSTGFDPWVVRLTASGLADELSHEARSACELADVLRPDAASRGRAIVLWVGNPTSPDAASVDAVYAPHSDTEGQLGTAHCQGLAIDAAIDDARRPCRQPAALADVALATLPRAAGDTRPGKHDLNERDEP